MTAILADIGGTNTRVALADGKQVRADSIRKFPNAEHPSSSRSCAAISMTRGFRRWRAPAWRRRGRCAMAWLR